MSEEKILGGQVLVGDAEKGRQSWREPTLIEVCKDVLDRIAGMSAPSGNQDKGRWFSSISILARAIGRDEEHDRMVKESVREEIIDDIKVFRYEKCDEFSTLAINKLLDYLK